MGRGSGGVRSVEGRSRGRPGEESAAGGGPGRSLLQPVPRTRTRPGLECLPSRKQGEVGSTWAGPRKGPASSGRGGCRQGPTWNGHTPTRDSPPVTDPRPTPASAPLAPAGPPRLKRLWTKQFLTLERDALCAHTHPWHDPLWAPPSLPAEPRWTSVPPLMTKGGCQTPPGWLRPRARQLPCPAGAEVGAVLQHQGPTFYSVFPPSPSRTGEKPSCAC